MSAAQVSGPTLPVEGIWFRAWKARTAARVFGPNHPLGVTPSRRWTAVTAGPLES